MYYNREKMDAHYSGILEKNMEAILAGGTVDPLVFNAFEDDRMALVTTIRISDAVSERIFRCSEELRAMEPGLYIYPPDTYHITVMDLLRGEQGRTLPDNIDAYIAAVQECADRIHPFDIEFRGLTASDNVVMVRGDYEDPLEEFRQSLRKTLRERGLLLEERYETISCHISVARIAEKLHRPEQVVEFVRRPYDFGTMNVSSMEVCFHNWYDTKKTQLKTILLT